MDNRRMMKALLVAAAVWAGACSSPSDSPTELSPAAKSRLADYCAKRDTCKAELGLTDVKPCPTSMCLAGEAEEPALLEFFDCQLAKECSAFFSDDACVAAAGTMDAERDTFLARCTAKASECGTVDFGEACPIVAMPIIRKGLMREFDACLARACSDVQACWNGVETQVCW
jgi:hypothetical protein